MTKPNWTAVDEIALEVALVEVTKSCERGSIPIGSVLLVPVDAGRTG